MKDWNEIEARYVTGNVSYRALAKEYGAALKTLERRGKNGCWVEKRRRHRGQLLEQTLEKDREGRMERIEKLQRAADKLLVRVEELSEAADLSPAGLKTLSEVLKNIRDAQMLQQAKPDAQEKQTLTVVLEGVGEFAA